MKTEKKANCLLDMTNCRAVYCPPDRCAGCGWDLKEDRRRAELLELYGLTRCKDGLYRLIIKRRGL